ncbi:hypothetical protein H5410_064592 [Solanum commersonii]|uniref:Uncharacterized protein n=1 Tax=Solanum commersonii TaxID=4109 RepID=A0A9J5VYZ2_SOLCO|nr:hypothetical protein H5410_064592 [Solanum commersonii]
MLGLWKDSIGDLCVESMIGFDEEIAKILIKAAYEKSKNKEQQPMHEASFVPKAEILVVETSFDWLLTTHYRTPISLLSPPL